MTDCSVVERAKRLSQSQSVLKAFSRSFRRAVHHVVEDQECQFFCRRAVLFEACCQWGLLNVQRTTLILTYLSIYIYSKQNLSH